MSGWSAVITLIATALLPAFAAPPAQAPPLPAGTETVQVNLVLIDLVARDRKDRPVSGLRREELRLLIDNEEVDPASILSFEEICGSRTASAALPPDHAAQTLGVPPRNIVLYFDFEQLTVTGRGLSLRAAKSFVLDRVAPPDRVMIVAHRKQLQLLQDFTTDRALLMEALNALQTDNSSAAEDPIEMWQDLATVSNTQCSMDRECPHRDSAAKAFAEAERVRARKSLRSIQDLLPALSVMKGRKALVLFTDVLRAEPGAQFFPLGHGWVEPLEDHLGDEMLALTREANSAGVSFYTIHASGLDDNTHEPFRDARGNGFTYGVRSGQQGRLPTVYENDRVDNSASYDAIRAGRDSALALQTMLAAETGGRSLQRTNDLGAVLDAARQDLSCYYLVGYGHRGPGDGGRHGIEILLRPASRQAHGDVTLRYRPYFHDISAADRIDRALGAALRNPGLFRTLPVSVEAFALAPTPSGRGVLVKTSVPVSSFFLAADSPSTLRGSAIVRGEIRRLEDQVCAFENQVPFKIQGHATRSLIFEAGCRLPEGAYELSVVVLDQATREIGARRTPLTVPPSRPSSGAYLSEVSLWTHDADSLLIASGAASIGIGDVPGREAFIPKAERRMHSGQEAKLTFLLCPRAGAAPGPGSPIRVRRELKGEEDRNVAGFRDLILESRPDADTGCYQVTSSIPAGTLGEGIYRFTIEASGQPLGSSIRREVDLAVEAP